MRLPLAFVALLCLAVCSGRRGADAVAAPAMVDVPGGRFLMGDLAGDGDPGERPVHEVSVRPFRLGRTEVTRAQFAAFVAATGYRTEAERDVAEPGCWIYDLVHGQGGAYLRGHSWRDPGFAQGDDHPVVCVSFNDAQAYVDWLRRTSGRPFRLPSNAEWEYAARAGSRTRYPWGDDPEGMCAWANGVDRTPYPPQAGAAVRGTVRAGATACSDGWFFTAPVASFRANAFGLHDMAGNAWEWTADCFRDSYDGAPTDGSADTGGGCRRRINRGGSWFNDVAWLRSANRDRDEPTNRFSHLGLRVAEDLPGGQ